MLIMAFLFNVLREIAHEFHEFSRNWESIKVFVFYYITNFHLTVNYKSLSQSQRAGAAGYVKLESVLLTIDS